MMNRLDCDYKSLLQDILDNGVVKDDRTGTGTVSIFGKQIRHKMSDGFPLLTTKKMPFNVIVTELLWFLRGDTNIKYLVDNGCNIWNGDCYKKFKESFSPMPGIQSSIPSQNEFIEKIKNQEGFADIWGDLGPIYGNQWRSWRSTNQIPTNLKDPLTNEYVYMDGVAKIDQISNLIEQLNTNPDSRRLMVSSWNVGELAEMYLPPCHYGFQVYTREPTKEEKIANPDKCRAISLMWNQRSVDTFLGLPFNIASYGLLLTMIADEVNMIPDELIGNLGDVHLYSNHTHQAKELISRDSFELPTVTIQDGIFCSSKSDFELKNYKHNPTIKAPLSN